MGTKRRRRKRRQPNVAAYETALREERAERKAREAAEQARAYAAITVGSPEGESYEEEWGEENGGEKKKNIEYVAYHYGAWSEHQAGHTEDIQLVQPIEAKGQGGNGAVIPVLPLCKAGTEGPCTRNVCFSGMGSSPYPESYESEFSLQNGFMVSNRDDNRSRKLKLCEAAVSAGLVCLAVVGTYELFDIPPILAIALGGAIGYSVARVLWLNVLEKGCPTDQEAFVMIGYKWAAFWLVALCAFRFLVNLLWLIHMYSDCIDYIFCSRRMV